WVDLWTRGMVGALYLPAAAGGTRVNGKLFPLGVDLRHHGFFVSADVYGLLEADSPRVVRTTLSSYKVDVLAGGEMWRCFGAPAEPLLRAVSKTLALDVKGLTLLPSGDLLWDGKAAVGKRFDLTDVAAKYLAVGTSACEFPGVAPVDRHPVQIAEPVYLTDVTTLPLATERLSPASEITPEQLKDATELLGLLRFDRGTWAVQPLWVRAGEDKAWTGETALDIATAKPKKGDTLGILKERASRLLRAKS
ncbi:MAG TPA: hypothetical protein VKD72_18500, partial [Gemmataceae bacterium]|nr:hypothetical protein [Gemmataceae bacterium]